MSGKALTSKQSKFVAAYAGNGTEAARKAGYRGRDHTLEVAASRLLRNAEVRAAIDARQAAETNPLVADRQGRQVFWSEIMKDEGQPMVVRLRASELLGRSEGDFLDRADHTGNVTIQVINPYAEGTK